VEISDVTLPDQIGGVFPVSVIYVNGLLHDVLFQLFKVSLAYTHHFIVAPVVEFIVFVTLLHVSLTNGIQVSFKNSPVEFTVTKTEV
jgi:hypothetical protein